MTAAQYIRDSTEHQREGFGPDMQRSTNRRFIERFGLVDSGREYIEFTSAFQGDQVELQRAIADMADGRFQVLCVGWEHRLTRNVARAEQIDAQVIRAGGWVAYSDSYRVAGSDWVSDTVHHFTNEMYSRNLSRMVYRGLEEKFISGLANGHAPIGTKHVYRRKDGTLTPLPEVHTTAIRVIDEQGLTVLRCLLEYYAANGSYQRTADYLNAAGYRSKRGGLFTAASIKTVVLNPFYGPEEIIRYHPGYADEAQVPTPPDKRLFPDDIHELWQRASRRRSNMPQFHPQSQKRVYPLHSLLICADCGGHKFHGQSSRRGDRMTRHVGSGECPTYRHVRADLIEQQIVEFLAQVEIPRNWRGQVRKLHELPDHDIERTRLEESLERLTKLHLWGDIPEAEYVRQRNVIRARLTVLQPAQRAIEDYQPHVDQVRTIGAKLTQLLATEKREAYMLFREFCELAFTDIRVSGSTVIEINPADRYREILAVGLRDVVLQTAVKRTWTHSTPQIGVHTSLGLISVPQLVPLWAALA